MQEIDRNANQEHQLAEFNQLHGHNFTIKDVKNLRSFIIRRLEYEENSSNDVTINNSDQEKYKNQVDEYNKTYNTSFTLDQLSALTQLSFSTEERCFRSTPEEVIQVDCNSVSWM
ncbi:hypothetical protein [Rhodoligotrophos defluvii]|uniref:hypothetical protein n=1 Tax=Rhodoligotrophos defluvii TaxID=2561934 RepID=UPI0010C99BE4|nr:hypothetical protein [Rhodoligotrophos defluvii]